MKQRILPFRLFCNITLNFKDITEFGWKIQEVDTLPYNIFFFKFLYAFQDQSYVRSK